MPIYEYYSPETNKIYSFFAKTLAQGKRIPQCPDRPGAKMVKLISSFAVVGKARGESDTAPASEAAEAGSEDPRMEAAMQQMERELEHADENDPRAMARLMRKMAELSGEKMDAPMEEAVRKLEEGADPDSLEEQLGNAFGPEGDPDDPYGAIASDPSAVGEGEPKGARAKFKARRPEPVRDPKLYDYD